MIGCIWSLIIKSKNTSAPNNISTDCGVPNAGSANDKSYGNFNLGTIHGNFVVNRVNTNRSKFN